MEACAVLGRIASLIVKCGQILACVLGILLVIGSEDGNAI